MEHANTPPSLTDLQQQKMRFMDHVIATHCVDTALIWPSIERDTRFLRSGIASIRVFHYDSGGEVSIHNIMPDFEDMLGDRIEAILQDVGVLMRNDEGDEEDTREPLFFMEITYPRPHICDVRLRFDKSRYVRERALWYPYAKQAQAQGDTVEVVDD
jgi:hypothetical protein